LQQYALQNQKKNIVRNYVTCNNSNKVVGFYSLAFGSVNQTDCPPTVAQGVRKYQIPVMILARLGVEQSEKGKGLGKALLKNAILRTLQAANIAGLKAIFVQAKQDEAKAFYEKYGFIPALNNPLYLFFPLGILQP